MTMTKVRADTLKIGDIIMPPDREVRLWMRRDIQQRNLPESALHLRITSIREAIPDKRGRWLMIETDQSAEWNAGLNPRPFKFKARPETPWPKLEAGVERASSSPRPAPGGSHDHL